MSLPLISRLLLTVAIFKSLSLSVGAQEATTAAPLLAQTSTPQPDPNRDRFSQPTLPLQPSDKKSILPTQTTPVPAAAAPSGPRFTVRTVTVTGSTIFGATEFDPITQPLVGKTLTLSEVQQAADAITQLYLIRGLLTSRAILPDQKIQDGALQIRVIEGQLEKIEVDGIGRLNPDYVRDRIQLGAAPPLSSTQLEDQLRLLKADPLFSNVEASLRPGSDVGKSILSVRVTEAEPFESLLGIDNYSPVGIGSERATVALRYRNLTGAGDEIAAAYSVSTGASNVYDFNYRLPVNPMNGTLQLRIAPNNNRVTDPAFSFFGIRGVSDSYEVSFRQPLIRSSREEFALSLGFNIQDSQTFLFNSTPFPFGIGPDAKGFTRTRVLKIGQDYLSRDGSGAWTMRSQFNLGIGLFNATTNADPLPDGQFFSWLGQVQRLQSLGGDNFLILGADVQLAANTLLPSQQFVIGGGQSIRGYRQNARSGDNGFRVSVEGRIPIIRDEAGAPVLQLTPFVEAGSVWNVAGNPNVVSNQRFLSSAGLGLLWQPFPRLSLRVDYGLPFTNLTDRGTNLQDTAVYFSATWRP